MSRKSGETLREAAPVVSSCLEGMKRHKPPNAPTRWAASIPSDIAIETCGAFSGSSNCSNIARPSHSYRIDALGLYEQAGRNVRTFIHHRHGLADKLEYPHATWPRFPRLCRTLGTTQPCRRSPRFMTLEPPEAASWAFQYRTAWRTRRSAAASRRTSWPRGRPCGRWEFR